MGRVCIMWYFVLGMKYMCKTCRKPCDDIPEHIRKVHGFSAAHIKEDLKNKPDAYKNAFEIIKWLRKNPMDIMLVERLNRKDVKRINQNKYIFYIYSEYSNNYFLPSSSLYQARHQCSLH